MIRRSSGLLTYVLFAVMASACRGPDDELAWDVDETRAILSSPRDLPGISTLGGYRVVVPLGLQRFRLTLVAEQSLHVGKGVTLPAYGLPPPTQPFGFLASMGRTLVDAESDVGSVYSFGDTPLRVAAGATVHGYVKSGAPVQTSRRARVDVGIQEDAPAMVEVFSWRVPPAQRNLGDRRGVAEGTPLHLEPGAYATLHVGAGSTVRLRDGRYQFDALNVEEGGQLETNNTLGAVYVWIRHALDLSGSMYSYARDPNILFGYSGTAAPTLRTAFRGTLVAPKATVSIPATLAPHRGAFFAKAIDIADGATIEHNSFRLLHVPPADPGRLCAECAKMARRAVGECCNDRHHFAATARRAEAMCESRCASNRTDTQACHGECEQRFAEAAEELGTGTEDCLREALALYSDCQVRLSYNPDTCAKLGHSSVVAVSCTGS